MILNALADIYRFRYSKHQEGWAKRETVIDAQGYRANVAMVILNHEGKVFWGKRVGQTSWQFPQGGVNEGEMPLVAMYRELYEEVGLRPQDVTLLAVTPGWVRYELPKKMIRKTLPLCIGQKQKWFLLKLTAADSAFNLNCAQKAEFDGWRWVYYWYPLSKVVYFKRRAYQKALRYFVRYQQQVEKESQMHKAKVVPLEPEVQTETAKKKAKRFLWCFKRKLRRCKKKLS